MTVGFDHCLETMFNDFRKLLNSLIYNAIRGGLDHNQHGSTTAVFMCGHITHVLSTLDMSNTDNSK